MPLPDIVRAYFARGPVYARAKATQEGYQAWVSVHLRSEYYRPDFDPSKKYIIRWAEVKNDLVERARPLNQELDYDMASNYEEIWVENEDEIEQVVSRWVTNLEDLGPPWKCDYPFG